MKPRLIHPCHFLLFQRGEPEVDPVFGDPVGGETWLAPVKLRGQVKWGGSRGSTVAIPTGAGNDPVYEGYFLCYSEEWTGAMGDELVIPPSEYRFIVVGVQSAAHYSGKGSMVKIFFSRRGATQ